jgi:hypothetical protein
LVSLTKKGRGWDIDLSLTESESKWVTMRVDEKGDEMEKMLDGVLGKEKDERLGNEMVRRKVESLGCLSAHHSGQWLEHHLAQQLEHWMERH